MNETWQKRTVMGLSLHLYSKARYLRRGEDFLDDGIPHLEMYKSLIY